MTAQHPRANDTTERETLYDGEIIEGPVDHDAIDVASSLEPRSALDLDWMAAEGLVTLE